MAKIRGKVKNFYNDKGFGFISSEKREVFVHFSNIIGNGFKTLDVGDTVEFEMGQGERGPVALNVKVLDRNPAINHSTEDRNYWWKHGEKKEEAFVREVVPLINRSLIVHPDKATDKTKIDLYNTQTEKVADLKSQETPFFTASNKGRGYDPQYTVTFNKKDYEYYNRMYPDAMVYFWVNWRQLQYKHYKVNPLYGVWEVSFSQLCAEIESGEAYLHAYIHREDDEENAKDSYLFDLKSFTRLL